MTDVAHKWGAEAVEEELDRLIERRSRKGEMDPDGAEELWKASVRAYTARQRDEMVARWRHYHEEQAERHRATLQALIEHHEEQAARFCSEAREGGLVKCGAPR